MRIFHIYIFIYLLLLTTTFSCSNKDPLFTAPTPVYPEIYEYPEWDPNGTRIIFRHNGIIKINANGIYDYDPELVGIWMINSDGTDPHLLIKDATSAEWSPDGEYISFSSGRQIFTARVVESNIDTTSIMQLTSEGNNFYPTWSHDGEWIAYDSDLPAGNTYSIWKMKNDGSSMIRIYDGARGANWSPNGDRIILFDYIDTKSVEIFSIDTSGGDLVRVTFNKSPKRFAKFSPDGDKIAYILASGANYNEIVIINADGSGSLKLVGDVCFSGLSWSPDGTMVAFSSKHTGDLNNHGTIWIINVDGSGLTQLTPGLNSSL